VIIVRNRIKMFVFRDKEIKEVEKEVNEWILVQNDIEVVNCSISTTDCSEIIIMLVYKVV